MQYSWNPSIYSWCRRKGWPWYLFADGGSADELDQIAARSEMIWMVKMSARRCLCFQCLEKMMAAGEFLSDRGLDLALEERVGTGPV